MNAVWDKLFGNDKSAVANDVPLLPPAMGLSNGMNMGLLGPTPAASAAAPSTAPLFDVAPLPPVVGETFSSIGLRNEGLREQLEKIELAFQNIEGIRNSFHEVLSPVDGLMRDLERTKSELFDVNIRMGVVSDAHDQLRADYREASTARDEFSENYARVKDEAQSAEASLRVAETALAEARRTGDVKDVRLEQLERDVAQANRRQALADDELVALKNESAQREKRFQEIDEQRMTLLDQNTILAQEGRALRTRAEDLSGTISKLNRQFSDLEVRHVEATRRNSDLESSALRDAAAHAKFKANHDETMESHRVRSAALQNEYETVRARHEASERILADSRRELLEKNIAHRDVEQKLADSTIQAAGHMKRAEKLADDLGGLRAQLDDMENGRKGLLEQYDSQTRSLRTKEAALSRAEKKIVALDARLVEIKASGDAKRDQLTARIAELTDQLAAERASRAFAEGALQSARAERLAFNRDAAAQRLLPRDSSYAAKPDSVSRDDDMPGNVTRLHG